MIYLVVQRDTEYGGLIDQVVCGYVDPEMAKKRAKHENNQKNEFSGKFDVISVFVDPTVVDFVDPV